jgi:hypothetical protein
VRQASAELVAFEIPTHLEHLAADVRVAIAERGAVDEDPEDDVHTLVAQKIRETLERLSDGDPRSPRILPMQGSLDEHTIGVELRDELSRLYGIASRSGVGGKLRAHLVVVFARQGGQYILNSVRVEVRGGGNGASGARSNGRRGVICAYGLSERDVKSARQGAPR